MSDSEKQEQEGAKANKLNYERLTAVMEQILKEREAKQKPAA